MRFAIMFGLLAVGVMVGEHLAGWNGEGFNIGQLAGGLVGAILGGGIAARL